LLKLDLDFNEAFNQLDIEQAGEKASALNEKLFQVFVWSVSEDVIKTLKEF